MLWIPLMKGRWKWLWSSCHFLSWLWCQLLVVFLVVSTGKFFLEATNIWSGRHASILVCTQWTTISLDYMYSLFGTETTYKEKSRSYAYLEKNLVFMLSNLHHSKFLLLHKFEVSQGDGSICLVQSYTPPLDLNISLSNPLCSIADATPTSSQLAKEWKCPTMGRRRTYLICFLKGSCHLMSSQETSFLHPIIDNYPSFGNYLQSQDIFVWYDDR